MKQLFCPCVSLGYTQQKVIAQLTGRRFKHDVSQRLLVAQETLVNKNRLSLPIVIFELDGVSGYWDE